jgi:hypothetical protein
MPPSVCGIESPAPPVGADGPPGHRLPDATQRLVFDTGSAPFRTPMPVTRLKILLVAAALVLFPAASALALSYRMMTDHALLQQAQGVALFEVVHVDAVQPGDSETRYLLRWQRGIAGNAAFAYEWLVLPGAESTSHQYFIDGIPLLRTGEQWLLFFARRADGVLQPVQLTLGMFRRFDASDGVASYLRTVDVAPAKGSGDPNAAFASRRDAQGFEQWLRGAAGGKSAIVDYLLPPDAPLAKYTFVMFGFPTPMPGRWFEFDAGTTVPVRAGAEGQFGAVHDVFESLRRAIVAWNDDAGSHVALRYAGTGSSTADSAINVLWNDPNNQIAGSFDCSKGGILGIGGSSATSSQTGTFGNMTWARRLRGFVVVQDGAACALDGGNGANGAELLAHELGHVLALAHSCGDSNSGSCDTTAKNTAIMRATLHGNRGAVLGSDDRAGIAVPYPAPAGATMPALVHRSGFEPGG